jgi:hypothetical protein
MPARVMDDLTNDGDRTGACTQVKNIISERISPETTDVIISQIISNVLGDDVVGRALIEGINVFISSRLSEFKAI